MAVCTGEVRTGEIGGVKACTAHVYLTEISTSEIGAVELCPMEIRDSQVGTLKIGTFELRRLEICSHEIGALKVQPRKIALLGDEVNVSARGWPRESSECRLHIGVGARRKRRVDGNGSDNTARCSLPQEGTENLRCVDGLVGSILDDLLKGKNSADAYIHLV
ncbi:hypothetical protein Srufu_070340 [Streptomyces libani subsp. rufus]|nr:hypothetical protein Srufu_070340 [Streptomyces libani subsp. rufus]